jgi:hypothetical protein
MQLKGQTMKNAIDRDEVYLLRQNRQHLKEMIIIA